MTKKKRNPIAGRLRAHKPKRIEGKKKEPPVYKITGNQFLEDEIIFEMDWGDDETD